MACGTVVQEVAEFQDVGLLHVAGVACGEVVQVAGVPQATGDDHEVGLDHVDAPACGELVHGVGVDQGVPVCAERLTAEKPERHTMDNRIKNLKFFSIIYCVKLQDKFVENRSIQHLTSFCQLLYYFLKICFP